MQAPTPKSDFAIGLDFGTSNSTIGLRVANQLQLAPLENDQVTIPSAVFYGTEKSEAFLIGRAAVAAYVDGAPGRLLRSLKSILGSALIDERTPIHRKTVPFSEIIVQYISELKRRTEIYLDAGIDSVVMGRPVQFVDHDDAANLKAERSLETIARAVGFKNVSFQFEPVAAALDFERQLRSEKIALIADIGGGTSDFSVVRLGVKRNNANRSADVLANGGIRVGGTDYDRYLSMAEFMPAFGSQTLTKDGALELPSMPYWDLSTWSSIHKLYDPKRVSQLRAIKYSARRPELVDRLIRLVDHRRGHSLLMDVEQAKIALSNQTETVIALDWVESGLKLDVSLRNFEKSVHGLYEKLHRTVVSCVASAGLAHDQIDMIFFTGGTSLVPSVRRAITSQFPNAEVVDGDQFGSVGLGLGIEAGLRYL
jgi:hypothetical chaperone protein